MYNLDDVINNRLNTVRPVQEGRIPFIGETDHVLIVESIETYTDKKLVEAAVGNEIAGLSVRAIFVVEQSAVHTPGSKVVKTWNLYKPAAFPNGTTDAERWVDFVCKLQGIAIGAHHASMHAMLKTKAEGGQQEAQIARGVRIRATGSKSGKPKTNAVTGVTSQYVTVSWNTFTQQDANLVQQTRAQLDKDSPYTPAAERAAARAVQPQQGYAQPQQMMQPPQAPVQYTQVAPQQFMPQQPVQQGYGQQPAQQPQGVPAGGFLSLLPQK